MDPEQASPPIESEEDKVHNPLKRKIGRRHFLAVAGIASAAAGLAGCQTPPPVPPAPTAAPPAVQPATPAPAPTPVAQTAPATYARTNLVKLSGLKVGQPTSANYPDANSPILLLKLGKKVPGGVGPDGDVVAYSQLCTHFGCPLTYKADTQILACGCHYSSFDPARGGMQVIGQATTNLPEVVLEVNGDDVIAVGMRGLIWGRQSNLQAF